MENWKMVDSKIQYSVRGKGLYSFVAIQIDICLLYLSDYRLMLMLFTYLGMYIALSSTHASLALAPVLAW